MNNTTTYVTLINIETGSSELRTTDIEELHKSLPAADIQDRSFRSGTEMLIKTTGESDFTKWKIEKMELIVLDREILPPNLQDAMIGNANSFNTELRIYISRP